MRDLNDKLLEVKANLKEKDRLEKMLNNIIRRKRELEREKGELYRQLQKEEKDVEKLEKMSLSNFINTILGTKWEKLDKEKKEAIAAKIKYDTVCQELNDLIKDAEKIENKIRKMGSLEQEYNMIIKGKEELLKSLGDSVAVKLDRIMEEESILLKRKKELEEAISAGNELLSCLKHVKKSVESAANWGIWDILGGDMIATLVKHSKLDSAKAEITRAQILLKKFARELEDVGGYIDININIGSFLTFADFFFDGIFSDLAVQSRIRDAEDRVSDTIYKVDSVIARLKVELKETVSKIEKFNEQRLKIVEQA